MARSGRSMPNNVVFAPTIASDVGLNKIPRQNYNPNGDAATTGWITNLGGTTNLYATLEPNIDDSDYITVTI
jgi:hypothetical protein